MNDFEIYVANYFIRIFTSILGCFEFSNAAERRSSYREGWSGRVMQQQQQDSLPITRDTNRVKHGVLTEQAILVKPSTSAATEDDDDDYDTSDADAAISAGIV